MTAISMAAALLSAGCVSLTPAQESTLAELQAFADATARFHQRDPVKIGVWERLEAGAGGTYFGGHNLIIIPKDVLGASAPARDVIMAHELGHWLLRHDFRVRGEPAREAMEHDANEAAVVILIQVKRIPEAVAVRLMHAYLAASARDHATQKAEPLAGHGHPCEEVAHLIARFPQYRLARTESCP
jgi:hypothetical protein